MNKHGNSSAGKGEGSRKRPELIKDVVRPVVVAVITAIAVTALTPSEMAYEKSSFQPRRTYLVSRSLTGARRHRYSSCSTGRTRARRAIKVSFTLRT